MFHRLFPCFRKQDDDGDTRRVPISGMTEEETKLYPTNYVTTAKYNIITFLPKNLFEQFCRVANLFFLLISALQVCPDTYHLTLFNDRVLHV